MAFYSHMIQNHSNDDQQSECPVCNLMVGVSSLSFIFLLLTRVSIIKGGPIKVETHLTNHLIKEHSDLVLASPELNKVTTFAQL